MRQLKIAQSITNRTEDSVARYLLDIAHIELLDVEEENNVAMKAKNGDQDAMDRLIRTNLRFVVSVAKQYQNKGMCLSDLISEGNLGLIKAAQRFDHTKGFKFITFAVYWIRQRIIQSISEHKRVVRLPGNKISDMIKVSSAALKLEQTLERTPTLKELSGALKYDEDKITDVLSNSGLTVSLDSSSTGERTYSLLELLADQNALCPEAALIADSLSADLRRLVNRLPGKQQIVLKYSYGIENYPILSNDDIAEIMELTKERVRQLKNKGIETLKGIYR